MVHLTREGWLEAAAVKLDKEFFASNGYELPLKIQYSCGFPVGSSKAIGQCWAPELSSDGITHIFICPTQSNPMRVLDILLHELIHACVGVKVGHRGEFKKLARQFGLVGKITSTYAEEGSELFLKLEKICKDLGQYPHKPMQKKEFEKKKSNGWVRLVSIENKDFKVVASKKSIEQFGMPLDPWGNEMILVKKEEED